jgi:hypothetical protein
VETQMGKSEVENGLLPWKLKIIIKTWFANKVIMLKNVLRSKKLFFYVMVGRKQMMLQQ